MTADRFYSLLEHAGTKRTHFICNFCFRGYAHNRGVTVDTFIEEHPGPPAKIVQDAFSWANSVEGIAYWVNIYDTLEREVRPVTNVYPEFKTSSVHPSPSPTCTCSVTALMREGCPKMQGKHYCHKGV